MKVNPDKAWCIYCKRTFTDTLFGPREHIFPRSLGGKQRLDPEIVCGNCNSHFSKDFELPPLGDSTFGFLRSMYGPGNEGRTERAHEKLSRWAIMTFKDTEKTVHYVGRTTPSASYPPPQFILQGPVGVLLAEQREGILDEMRRRISDEQTPRIIALQVPSEIEFHPCAAIVGTSVCWFVSAQNAEAHERRIQNWIDAVLPRFGLREVFSLKTSRLRESFIHLQFDNDHLGRLLIKMGMNLIAFREGHSFMGHSGFDPFREMVLKTNAGANQAVKKRPKTSPQVRLKHPLENPHHLVCIQTIPTGLRFTAQFYCNVDVTRFRNAETDLEILSSEYQFDIPGIFCQGEGAAMIEQFTESKSAQSRERFFRIDLESIPP